MTPDELRAAGLPKTAHAYENIAEGRRHGAETCHNWVQWALDELLGKFRAERQRAEMCEAWHIRYTTERQRAEAAVAELLGKFRAERQRADEAEARAARDREALVFMWQHQDQFSDYDEWRAQYPPYDSEHGATT